MDGHVSSSALFLRCAISAFTVCFFGNWILPLSLPTIRIYLSIPRPTLRVEFDVELGTDCMVLNNTSAAAAALKLHLVAYIVLGMSCFFRCIISSAPNFGIVYLDKQLLALRNIPFTIPRFGIITKLWIGGL